MQRANCPKCRKTISLKSQTGGYASVFRNHKNTKGHKCSWSSCVVTRKDYEPQPTQANCSLCYQDIAIHPRYKGHSEKEFYYHKHKRCQCYGSGTVVHPDDYLWIGLGSSRPRIDSSSDRRPLKPHGTGLVYRQRVGKGKTGG